MARLMALRPLTRLARRLQLPQRLMRAQPTMRLTRRRPRSIAAPGNAGNGVVRRRRHRPRPAQLPPSSESHPEQPPQQQRRQQSLQQLTVSSSKSDYLVAIQYVNLVKATLNSTEKFRTFLRILNEYREKLAREGEGADLLDMVSQVDEVLQDHPALIVAFRQFFN